MPFEREIYAQMLIQHLKEVEAEDRKMEAKHK